ncbi:hypothetical protein HGRIS_012810 [Hohenbuehelia grisea]|uniref:Uncharacterized protein n=1 Tax=Hohenbuehelia grisea TaxID=104357 RepID=A0ABR3ITK4_9AGAR
MHIADHLALEVVLDACNLDSRTATWRQLDELDPQFICEVPGCMYLLRDEVYYLMSWRYAISKHCHHFSRLKRIDDIFAKEPEHMEAAGDAILDYIRSRPKELSLYSCIRCEHWQHTKGLTLAELRSHYKKRRSINCSPK